MQLVHHLIHFFRQNRAETRYNYTGIIGELMKLLRDPDNQPDVNGLQPLICQIHAQRPNITFCRRGRSAREYTGLCSGNIEPTLIIKNPSALTRLALGLLRSMNETIYFARESVVRSLGGTGM